MKMETQKIIKKIAENNNVSEKIVTQEIEKAIEIGMNSKEPKVQAHWKEMSKNGEKPTVDDVIVYIAKEINKRM